MGEFRKSLLEFLAFLTVLIERTGVARDRPGTGGKGTCRSRFELLHREDSVIDHSQSSLEAARRPPLGEGRSPITILDTVQVDLLSSKFIISFRKL